MSRTVAGMELFEIAAGEAEVVNAREAQTLHVIPGSGATVTVSKIDQHSDPGSHDSDTSQDYTTETTIAVVWPFYRVSTSGGSARVASM